MSPIEAKRCINDFLASSLGKKNYSPTELVDNVQKCTRITVTMGDGDSVVGSPRLGYIKSNIKSFYYVIFCDSCNARCRKAYPTRMFINDAKVLKFLCGKCAGKKYERKKEYEKRALEYLFHPEKLGSMNYRNLSLKQSMAILEAGFIEDKIRERAERNVMKYLSQLE